MYSTARTHRCTFFFGKPTKAVDQFHGARSLNFSLGEAVERSGSPGEKAVVVPRPRCQLGTANTHKQKHTVDISRPTSFLAFLPASVCASAVLFPRTSCSPPLADMCVVLHHYTERRGERESLSKTNAPRRPNLSPPLWQFITVSQLYTPHNTHRHIHKNTNGTQKTSLKKKKEQINLLQPAVRAFMCSTPFDSNPQEHETLCVPREARKNETHSDLPPQEYMGAKTVQFYTSIRSSGDRPRQKTALWNVDKWCFQTTPH